MPYVRKDLRDEVDLDIDVLANKILDCVVSENGQGREGLLNYTITKLVNDLYPDASYAEFNNAYGVMMCAAAEFYRRRIVPYEDKACKKNGDVFPTQNE